MCYMLSGSQNDHSLTFTILAAHNYIDYMGGNSLFSSCLFLDENPLIVIAIHDKNRQFILYSSLYYRIIKYYIELVVCRIKYEFLRKKFVLSSSSHV